MRAARARRRLLRPATCQLSNWTELLRIPWSCGSTNRSLQHDKQRESYGYFLWLSRATDGVAAAFLFILPRVQMLLENASDLFLREIGVTTLKSTHRGATHLQAAGDFGFADTGTVQFPDFRDVRGRSCRPAQTSPAGTRMRQTSPSSFP